MHPIILVTSLFYMMMCNLVELLVSLVICYNCMFLLLEIICAVSPSLYMDLLYGIPYHTAYEIVKTLSILKVNVNDIYYTKIINYVFYKNFI